MNIYNFKNLICHCSIFFPRKNACISKYQNLSFLNQVFLVLMSEFISVVSSFRSIKDSHNNIINVYIAM